ncbi:MAG: hypothetical protein J6M03_03535, partial [Clostridia bacterium]|nr:hypothetical protein [Clostridia bacterium]
MSRAEKNADGCIEVCFFTPYSSTASGPPSLTREGFCKSRFWATDGCAAITEMSTFYASNCSCTLATIYIKPSPVGEGGSTERLA